MLADSLRLSYSEEASGCLALRPEAEGKRRSPRRSELNKSALPSSYLYQIRIVLMTRTEEKRKLTRRKFDLSSETTSARPSPPDVIIARNPNAEIDEGTTTPPRICRYPRRRPERTNSVWEGGGGLLLYRTLVCAPRAIEGTAEYGGELIEQSRFSIYESPLRTPDIHERTYADTVNAPSTG